jgi:hypothetical protein
MLQVRQHTGDQRLSVVSVLVVSAPDCNASRALKSAGHGRLGTKLPSMEVRERYDDGIPVPSLLKLVVLLKLP